MRQLIVLILPVMMLASSVIAAPGEDPARPAAMPPAVLDSSHLIDTILGLVLVLGVLLGLAWLVKRFMGAPGLGGKGQVRVIGGASLGPRERAVLVEVSGERLLLGVAPGQVRTLHVLAPEVTEESEEGFAEQLGQVQEQQSQEAQS